MSLPFEVRPLTESRFEPECIRATIGRDLTAQIESVASQYRTSAGNLLLACWQTLMWRLTGHSEIVIGNLCDGRKHEELDGALGLFAKWLPIRCRFEAGIQFSEVLVQITQATRDAEEWREYFTWEQNGPGPQKDSESPFFSVAFEYEQKQRNHRAGALTFSPYKQHVCFDRFKVKLCCSVQDDALLTEFFYDSGSITAEATSGLIGQFTRLLENVLSNPQEIIDELELLSADERRQLLVQFNQTKKEYSLSSGVHELFEAQAARFPDQPAVVLRSATQLWRTESARQSTGALPDSFGSGTGGVGRTLC